MAVFNAASEGYEVCKLDGKPVAFTNMRLDRQTVPDALYCYDIRDSDNCDLSAAEVTAHVMVSCMVEVMVEHISKEEFSS